MSFVYISAPSEGGGGSGSGTENHGALTNRSATDQHPIGAITGLQIALDGKAAASHTHSQYALTSHDHNTIYQPLGNYAAEVHTHAVTALTATGTRDATTFLRGDNTWATPPAAATPAHSDLTGRTLADQHPIGAVTGLQAALDGKAAATHTHAQYATTTTTDGLTTRLTTAESDITALEAHTHPQNLAPTLTHSANGVLSVNMANGHSYLVNASADITGFTWPSNPGLGAVVGLWVRNSGTKRISVDISAGFRARAGDTLTAQTLDPGGLMLLSGVGDETAWNAAGGAGVPYIRDVDVLDVGTPPVVPTVKFFDSWSIGYATGQTGTVATTAPANSAGKTGILVITGTGGQDSGGILTGWIFKDRLLSAGTTDMVAEVYVRDMDGTAADAPSVGGGAIRALSITVLEGTTAAKVLAAAVWQEHPSGTSFNPDAVTTTVDGSIILTYGMNRYATRTYSGPSNMLAAFNVCNDIARGHMLSYVEKATAGAFDPGNFTVTSGSSTDYMTRSFIIAP